MIWAKEEQLSRSEIKEIQLARLKEQVQWNYDRVAPYRAKMDAIGIRPEHIKSLDDLKNLPFVVKQDFRDNYPFGLFAVERDKLERIHASSGTTGKPTVVGYTLEDMKNWTETVTRIAAAGGAKPGDLAQISFGYGMFTGALGLHFGLDNLGCTIAPTSSGNTQKQIMFMQDLGTNVLVATPSYALYIGETIRKMGLDPSKDLNVKVGLFGGEGMTEAMRQEMYSMWGEDFKATQNYGMSELNGPGVAGECLELCGMHINEDHFIAEVIDPVTGEVLPEGEKGELVITCLTKKALPMLRYRTKDITRLFYEPCKCGRTTARMENLSGRSDDMLIIRGVNVFPSQIEEVLLKTEGIAPHYEIVVNRDGHLDSMIIKVELVDDSLLDSYAGLEQLSKKVRSNLRTILGLDAEIRLLAPETLPRFEGKSKRVTDNRKSLGLNC